MSINESGVGRTEPIGAPIPPAIPSVVSTLPTAALSSQIEQLTAVVSELKSRMDLNDRRAVDTFAATRPPPAPPFHSLPGPSSIPYFTYTPTPSLGTNYTIHNPSQPITCPYPTTLQTQAPLSAIATPFSMSPHGFQDAISTSTYSSRQPHQNPQPWQHVRSDPRPLDRAPLQRPQMVNPASCWGPPGQRPHFGSFNQEQQQTRVRMEPPRFDGTEVNNWIRGVQFYFDHVGTPEDQRLHYVIMLFEPVVADWVWNYCSSHEYVTWYEFLDDVRRRFDPNCYTSHIGLLKKLQQIGNVSDYQLAFEKIQNNAVGVPDHVLLELYVAGLKQPIQDEVLLHRPPTLAAAFALAIQIASCRSDTAQASNSFSRRPWPPRDTRSTWAPARPSNASHGTPAPVSKYTPALTTSSDAPKYPIIRLSAAEKAERFRQGLCYYCPEKWISGHVCKHRFLAYMGVGDDEDDPGEQNDDKSLEEVITADLSHLHTIDGKRRSKSLTLSGVIGAEQVSILVDTGSSHDFLHPRIAEKLRLPLTAVQLFRVYVDLHILPVHRPDVVLGMEWLESLGRVTMDYIAKSMEFVRGKDLIVLKGSAHPPKRVSLASLASIVSRASLYELYELVELTPESDSAGAVEFPEDCRP